MYDMMSNEFVNLDGSTSSAAHQNHEICRNPPQNVQRTKKKGLHRSESHTAQFAPPIAHVPWHIVTHLGANRAYLQGSLSLAGIRVGCYVFKFQLRKGGSNCVMQLSTSSSLFRSQSSDRMHTREAVA